MTTFFRSRARALSLGAVLAVALVPVTVTASAAPAAPVVASTRVIVLLRASAGPAGRTPASRAVRAARASSVEQPDIAQVQAHGGTVDARFSLIDGFAASVPAVELAALEARPDVAAVVPDRLVRLPRPGRPSATPPGRPRTLPADDRDVCPADPAKPLLEPEALSIMRAASNDAATPSAADLATGAGVTVGVIGNGIDVRNPDLVRGDGSPVVVDYRDFAGTGTRAPAAASESMGDTASIAAQGRQVYDLASFGAVPSGCTIRVRGVAPAARVVALKVTDGSSFYDSTLVEAIDYAVEVAHVDVLNESLGDNAYPDTDDDPLTLANAAAVAAGTTITTASGDAGANSTIGSPASSVSGAAGIISTGATTQLQLGNQVGYYGPDETVRSGDVAGFSSGGFAQTGRTVDVVAPGSQGWSLCTDDASRYLDCPAFPGSAKGLQAFAGTSESAPLTAGVAALVIERYRTTHDGASPSPDLVKQIITSTTDDIGAPAQEQGSGEVDALRAVQLAGTVRDGSDRAASRDVLVSPTARTLTLAPGHAGHASIRLDNPSTRTRRLVLSRRAPRLIAVRHERATLPDGHVVSVPFTVAPGTDRISLTAGLRSAGGDYPEVVLVDPAGVVANDAGAEGPTNTVTVEADRPAAGAWQALVLDYAYTGPVDLAVSSSRNVVRVIKRLTLAPGARRTVEVRVPGSAPGDRAFAVTVRQAGSPAVLTSVPVVARTQVSLHHGQGTFRGVAGSGSGRPSALYGTSTFLLHVPSGAPALRVRIHLAHGGQRIDAYLTAPSGDALDEESNLPPGSNDPTTGGREVDLAAVRPQAGTWRVALGLDGSADGARPSTAYTGRVTLETPSIRATGVPHSSSTVLSAGSARTITLRVTNRSAVPHAYVVDPRLTSSSWLALRGTGAVAISAADPLPVVNVPVPPQSTELSSTMTATKPLAGSIAPASFSFPGSNSDPEVYDVSRVGTLRLDVRGRQLQDGPWLELPVAAGPFSATGIPAPFRVDLHATVRTRAFDPAVTSSTGDPWPSAVGAPQPVTPLVVEPGRSADITVTLTPSAPARRVVRGTLSVLGWDPQAGVSSTQAVFPYTYRVG